MADKKARQAQADAEGQGDKERAAQENEGATEEAAAEKERALQGSGSTSAGGASESQQPPEKLRAPGSTDVELPDLDPQTRAGVDPLPARSVAVTEQYDDDLKGQPGDSDDE